MKFAQLSDIHLMPESACRCWWMHESAQVLLEQAIEQINGIPDIDFVVLTGDLVDRADPWSFERLQEVLGRLRIPYWASVGNHDFDQQQRRGRFGRQAFIEWCERQFAFDLAPTGFVDYVASPMPGLKIVALDASLGPFPYPQGRIRPEQLDWLQQTLNTYADEGILVLVHQPPLASRMLFRKYRILPDESLALRRVLQSHQHIVGVLSGHLHVPKVYRRRGIPYLTAPSVIGPVSAFRVFDVQQEYSPRWDNSLVVRYDWHLLPMKDPRPFWHGLMMGGRRDRRGQYRIPQPDQWQGSLARVGKLLRAKARSFQQP